MPTWVPRLSATLLAIPAALLCQDLDVTVTPTPTQAVLVYYAPDESPCRVEVSESPSFAPLAHDVDPVLFPGADQDTRPGNVVEGRARYFVAGRRTAEPASDATRYSRALQANTQHYYRITCGASTAAGTFHTANIPLGDTSVEQPPFDSSAPFNYAWPSVDLVDKTRGYVDPLTGVLLKRMTGPGEWMDGIPSNILFSTTVFDPNGAWTSPNNAAGGSTKTLAAYSGSSSDPLFLSFAVGWQVAYTTAGGWGTAVGVDDFLVNAFGYGSDASTANRAISVCWSADSGQTCATNTVDLVLPKTSPGSTTGPSAFPSTNFSGWGAYLSKGVFMPRTGTVNVSGNTVTRASGGYFKPDWAAGARLYIAGSSPACASNYCTIASMQSASSLSIVESASLAGAAFWEAAAGLKAWKKTATGTVYVSFSFNAAQSSNWTMDLGGEFDSCGHNPVTVSVDANGNPISPSVPGFLCMARTAQYSRGGSLYVIIPSTGESRLLSNFSGTINTGDPLADRLIGDRWLSGLKFDPNDSTILYHSSKVNGASGNAQSIFKIQYTGNFAAWQPVYSGAQPADHMTWKNLTPASTGMDLLSQIEAAIPGYDPTIFGTFLDNDGEGMAGKYYVIDGGPGGGQDAPCSRYFFDTSTAPATFAKKADSYSSPSLRWGGCHTGNLAGFSDYAMILAKQMADGTSPTRTLYGPHLMSVTQVLQNGSWTSNTSFSASYADICPTDLDPRWIALGATGAHCLSIQTAGEPCSRSPNISVGENAKFPCPYNANYSMLQPLAEGDWIVDSAHLSTDGERMRVLRKTQNPDGTLTLVLQRGVGPCVSTVAALNGWTAAMAVTGACRVSTYFNSGSDTTNTWLEENSTLVAAHNDIGVSPTPGNISVAGAGGAGYMIRFDKPTSAIGQPQDYGLAGYSTKFAGNQVGTTSGLQSYPSLKQWYAPASEKGWILDVRSLNPSTGVGDESPSRILAGTSTLVAGTVQVYKTPVLGGGRGDPKRTPLLGYAGPYLLRDISGPFSSITDSDAWTYCYAYQAGECRADANTGDAYTNVPKAGPLDGCYSNSFSIRAPCVFMASPPTSQVVQWDISQADPQGTHWRRLTMGLAGWGRQYQFANARSLPDGSWAILRGYWPDGKRGDLLLAKLPPWPGYDGIDRSTFVKAPVRVSVDHGFIAARIRFGYAENGPADRFFCTSRQEACSTGGDPFAWESEGPAWTLCRTRCVIEVPARSGRVLYYAVDQKTEWGSVKPGSLQVLTAP
jgi:hypothetical protein